MQSISFGVGGEGGREREGEREEKGEEAEKIHRRITERERELLVFLKMRKWKMSCSKTQGNYSQHPAIKF